MTQTVATPTDRDAGGGEHSRLSRRSRRRSILIALAFLAPALVILGALVVYPIVYTLVRSLFDASGDTFVGPENYIEMFRRESTFTAIRNNVIWVIVAPVACTILGLIFAVLMDKIRWSTAFKLIIFMPMAISMLAAGVIFRMMFQESPQLGVVNAGVVAVHDLFADEAAYPGANVRPDSGFSNMSGVIISDDTVTAGDSANIPLVGIRADSLPDDTAMATLADRAGAEQITGTVWLDFVRGGGGVNGVIDPSEAGLPGIRVDAVNSDGTVMASATTDAEGRYTIDGLEPGAYIIALPAENFDEGYQGVSWLGEAFITGVIILSYVWIWAGFAMIMIASGLSAIDRSLQEAARMDGANEWQVFRRITAPLLAPVIVVVFVTLIINVLKIFDLVYVIPPGVSKPAANVIAVEMWTVSFGGGNDYGLGSALALLLLLLVLPSMIINIRRFREERQR